MSCQPGGCTGLGADRVDDLRKSACIQSTVTTAGHPGLGNICPTARPAPSALAYTPDLCASVPVVTCGVPEVCTALRRELSNLECRSWTQGAIGDGRVGRGTECPTLRDNDNFAFNSGQRRGICGQGSGILGWSCSSTGILVRGGWMLMSPCCSRLVVSQSCNCVFRTSVVLDIPVVSRSRSQTLAYVHGVASYQCRDVVSAV